MCLKADGRCVHCSVLVLQKCLNAPVESLGGAGLCSVPNVWPVEQDALLPMQHVHLMCTTA